MEILKKLFQQYTGLQTFFKSFFLLLILFLMFFAINLFIAIKNKPQSAYTSLNNDSSTLMLQDTRVHNWNELEEKKSEVRGQKSEVRD